MKNIFRKYGKIVVGLALILTTVNVNTCCWLTAYQSELPKGADKLSKIKR